MTTPQSFDFLKTVGYRDVVSIGSRYVRRGFYFFTSPFVRVTETGSQHTKHQFTQESTGQRKVKENSCSCQSALNVWIDANDSV